MAKITDYGDHVDYGTMDNLPLDTFIKELEALEGVRVYEVDQTAKTCMVGMELPDKESELGIIVDIMGDASRIDSEQIPLVTPASFLQVRKVFMRYDLQLGYHLGDK